MIEGELVPFHFGNLAGETRASVEGHLVGCSRCLQAYLEVKRAIETGAGWTRRPSLALRARLRADVAAEVLPRRRSRVRLVGAVAASLVAAAGLVGLVATRSPGRVHPSQPASATPPATRSTATPSEGMEVDSARPVTAGPQFL
jgi:hypothetical protein